MDGWDFEAEDTQETEDAGNEKSKVKAGKIIPPVAAGALGGAAGAGLLECLKVLYIRRKGKNVYENAS